MQLHSKNLPLLGRNNRPYLSSGIEVMVGENLSLPINDTSHVSVAAEPESCHTLLHLDFAGYVHCGLARRMSEEPKEFNVTCPLVRKNIFERFLFLLLLWTLLFKFFVSQLTKASLEV